MSEPSYLTRIFWWYLIPMAVGILILRIQIPLYFVIPLFFFLWMPSIAMLLMMVNQHTNSDILRRRIPYYQWGFCTALPLICIGEIQLIWSKFPSGEFPFLSLSAATAIICVEIVRVTNFQPKSSQE